MLNLIIRFYLINISTKIVNLYNSIKTIQKYIKKILVSMNKNNL